MAQDFLIQSELLSFQGLKQFLLHYSMPTSMFFCFSMKGKFICMPPPLLFFNLSRILFTFTVRVSQDSLTETHWSGRLPIVICVQTVPFALLPLPPHPSVLCSIEAASCFPSRGQRQNIGSPKVITDAIKIPAAEAIGTIGAREWKRSFMLFCLFCSP